MAGVSVRAFWSTIVGELFRVWCSDYCYLLVFLFVDLIVGVLEYAYSLY